MTGFWIIFVVGIAMAIVTMYLAINSAIKREEIERAKREEGK